MTKKFAVAAEPDGSTLNNTEFVIPALTGSCDTFVGLETGRSYACATIIFTGVELSQHEVMSKIQFDYNDNNRVKRIVESFLVEVTSQKIGSPVTVQVDKQGEVSLSKLSKNSEPGGGKPNLP